MNFYYKTLSTLSFILEWNRRRKSDFNALFLRLLKGEIVICGIWGCHLRHMTRPLATSDSLKSHIWQPQKRQVTIKKHRFGWPKKCKKNGSCWQSSICKNVDFLRFFHPYPVCFKQWPVFRGQNSEFIWQLLEYPPTFSPPTAHTTCGLLRP